MSDRSGRWIDSQTRTARGPSRYDIHLVAIPVVFLGAILLTLFGQATLQQSMGVASLIGITVLADAVFLHPPTEDGTE
ncbi:MAG: hypothetical protein ACOCTH_03830 [Halodesulfurarchaeum sp.]